MTALDNLLARLSRPSPLLIAATATTLLIAVPTLRLAILQRQLAARITSHQTLTGDDARRKATSASSSPKSIFTTKTTTPTPSNSPSLPGLGALKANLPPALLTDPAAHNIFYDISTLAVPSSSLPPALTTHDLLTAYLQHTLTLFSRTPQAYVLWAMSGREQRRSFERDWIESLPFEEGGVVCGLYRVLERGVEDEGKKGWVCFEMGMGKVEGRLVIGVGAQEGEGEGEEGGNGKKEGGVERERMVFSTETWMWVRREEGVVMPMERAVPRFMHRVGSWSLLVRGTEWLQGLGR
ncbi:uncharacterized protein HMPREF1541_03807 [Cyphellophora europaea CBS 101466]|uniref:Uncharacterized protein n=1 Tax=Cyphellophora europaea (strain CBS 101466) TaxID=1220924 RepID=W2S1G1_CYPE1|nr:uncharacterized protein HMPREF1541_03807 [Cyphellophora europaea CBS 101466]ETN41868.1 hypothetical protein HMPREF1541_03807 [Cyphellophora europaea CBS 101466]